MQIYHYLTSRWNKFSDTLAQYVAILKLMTADSVLRFKKEIFLILFTGFLGFSFQAWTVGLAFYYAKTMEKGDVIKLLVFRFNARTSAALLFMCGLTILISLLLSAWLIYFSRTRSLVLRRRYEEFCAKRIFSSFASSLRVWPFDQDFSDDKVITRLARKDARCCGRVLWMFTDIIVPVITFLVAIGTLLYVNTLLTLLIFALIAISAGFLYKVNIVGARSSSMMETHSEGAGREYLHVIQWHKATAFRVPGDELWLEKNIFSSGKIKKYLDAYEKRLKAVEYSQLISNILLALAVFLILLILGGTIIFGGQGWGKLIIYLVALRFLMTNLKQINNKITNINRLYPQIKRYFQFIENTTVPAVTAEKHHVNYAVVAGINHMEGSLTRWDLHNGSRLGLISPVELNRYTLAFLTNCLLGHAQEATRDAMASMWFVTSQYGCLPGRPLRESLGFPSVYNWQDLQKEMGDTGLMDKLEAQLPHDLENPVARDIWNKVGPDLKFTLALLNAIRSECLWIMLEERGFRALPDTARKYFLNRLSDRITAVVFYRSLEAVGSYGEDITAVIADSNVAGLGSVGWFKENQCKIMAIMDSAYSKDFDKGSRDLDSDDEFDFDDV